MTTDDLDVPLDAAPEAADLLSEVGLGSEDAHEHEGEPGPDAMVVLEDHPATEDEVQQLLALVQMLTTGFWSLTTRRLGLSDEIHEQLTTVTAEEQVLLELFAPGAVPPMRRMLAGAGGPWPFVAAIGLMSFSRVALLRRAAHVATRPPSTEDDGAQTDEAPTPGAGVELDSGTAPEHDATA